MASKLTLEEMQIVPITNPLDGDAGNITGDYVSLKDYNRVLVLVQFGDGTAGQGDLTIVIEQAQDVAGTGAKPLNVLETGRIFAKEGAADLTAVGKWTRKTQATADEQYTDETSAEQAGLWAFELKAEDLDVANGFDTIRADIQADGGAAKLVTGLYILTNPRYTRQPEDMPSAIVD